MRRASRVAASVAILGVLSAPADAGSFGSSAVGTTAGEFLQLGAGARAGGMGEAYSAAAEDADALYWNPAALINIDQKSATFMHVPYIASSFYDYAAYGQTLGKYGAFGAGLQYFSAGSIAETDQIGTPLGSYAPSDSALSLGYAYQLTNGYSWGASLKTIHSTLLNTASAVAGDFGVLSRPYLNQRLTLAFTLTNWGQDLNYGNGARESLPQTIRFGSAFDVTQNLTTTLDVSAPRGNQPYVAAGVEYWVGRDNNWAVAGRLGYNTLASSSLGGLAGASFGFGLRVHKMIVDYALVPDGILGLTQRISLTLRWSKVDMSLKNLKSLNFHPIKRLMSLMPSDDAAAAPPPPPTFQFPTSAAFYDLASPKSAPAATPPAATPPAATPPAATPPAATPPAATPPAAAAPATASAPTAPAPAAAAAKPAETSPKPAPAVTAPAATPAAAAAAATTPAAAPPAAAAATTSPAATPAAPAVPGATGGIAAASVVGAESTATQPSAEVSKTNSAPKKKRKKSKSKPGQWTSPQPAASSGAAQEGSGVLRSSPKTGEDSDREGLPPGWQGWRNGGWGP